MKISRLIILPLLLCVFVFTVNGTAAVKKMKTITGTVVMVGNEPFTEPALQINGKTVYKFSCDSLMQNTIKGIQGKRIRAYYTAKIVKLRTVTIDIKKYDILKNRKQK